MASLSGSARTYAAARRYISGCSGGAICESASTATAQRIPSSMGFWALRFVASPHRARAPILAASRRAQGKGCQVANAPRSSRTHRAETATGSAPRAAHLRALPVASGISSLELEEHFVLPEEAELLPRRPLQRLGLDGRRQLAHGLREPRVLLPQLAVALLLPF